MTGKWERRDRKRKNRKKMKMDGKGNVRLWNDLEQKRKGRKKDQRRRDEYSSGS